MSEFVTAIVEDAHVRVTLPDDTVELVPHPGRIVAGLLVPGLVQACVSKWSGGQMATIEFRPPRDPRVPTTVGETFTFLGKPHLRRFSLQPV